MRSWLLLLVMLLTATPLCAQSLNQCAKWQRDFSDSVSAHCLTLSAYRFRSLSVYLEEDFLQRVGPTSDRNYTMGLGFGRNGPFVVSQNHDLFLRRADRVGNWLSNYVLRPLSLGTIPKDVIKNVKLDDVTENRAYSEMMSGTAFTPKNLRDSNVVQGDRPYAFLLGWTVTRVKAPDGATTVYSSDLTLGTIGSRLGRNVQRSIHHWSRQHSGNPDPPDPKGWRNQIMDVPSLWLGIPTARYSFTRSTLLADVPTFTNSQSHVLDVAQDWTGEIGYYTDATMGLRARVGLFSVPFWAWRQDPLTIGSRNIGPGKVCINLLIACADAFLYGGAKVRAIAYNALLQGYPGYTGYHIPWSQRKYTGTEIETGIAATFSWGKDHARGVQAVFEMFAHRSAEYAGPLQHAHTWGGIFLTPFWP